MKKNYLTRYNPSDYSLTMAFQLLFTLNGQVELSEETIGVPPSEDNPERTIIKKDLFEKLSKESKEIVETVLNAPKEVDDVLRTEKYGLFSKNLIKQFFLRKGWRKEKISKAFKELKTYTENLD